MQGVHDEGAEAGAGMGQGEVGGGEAETVDGDKVDVDGTVAVGSVGIAVGGASAYAALYGEQTAEHVVRPAGRVGVKHHAEVKETVRRLIAPGFGLDGTGEAHAGIGPRGSNQGDRLPYEGPAVALV